jgi:hypothetical protein
LFLKTLRETQSGEYFLERHNRCLTPDKKGRHVEI